MTNFEHNIHEYNIMLGFIQLINEYNIDIIILLRLITDFGNHLFIQSINEYNRNFYMTKKKYNIKNLHCI